MSTEQAILIMDNTIKRVNLDTISISTLSVTENGSYVAAETGVEGWSTVNVNVPIFGIDPDTGNRVQVVVDENGYIQYIPYT